MPISWIKLQLVKDLSLNDRSDAGGKANGLLMHLQRFDSFLTLEVVRMFFSLTETVNVTLKHSKLRLHKAAKRGHTTSLWRRFWRPPTEAAHELDLEGPTLPRPKNTMTARWWSGISCHSITQMAVQAAILWSDGLHINISGFTFQPLCVKTCRKSGNL